MIESLLSELGASLPGARRSEGDVPFETSLSAWNGSRESARALADLCLICARQAKNGILVIEGERRRKQTR